MRFLEFCIFCALFAFVFYSMASDAAPLNEDDVLMKNISDLHFQLFSSIQKKTKMIKTAVFETQCSGSGCTFNGCESSGSETCDGQMFTKLNTIQTSINNFWKKKPKAAICKQGWKRYNGHCYHLFSAKMNWFQAQIFCRNQGTTLLQINNATENKWLTKTFPNDSSFKIIHINAYYQTVLYWIDFTDNGTEGKWVAFATGKSEYTRWASGQPDNHVGKENCAVGNYIKTLWNDVPCDVKYQVMCEASGSEF